MPVVHGPRVLPNESVNPTPSQEKTPINDHNNQVTPTSQTSVTREISTTYNSLGETTPVIVPTSPAINPEFALTPELTEVMTRANTHYTDVF